MFGSALAAEGNALIVGVSSDNTGGADAGAVYIFDCQTNPLECTERNKIFRPTPVAGDWFGTSVALHENILVVGASRATAGGKSLAGIVLVFECTDLAAGTCVYRATLQLVNPVAYDNFGTSVDVYNGVIVVGAINRDINVNEVVNCGSIGIYQCTDISAGTCTLRTEKFASDPADIDRFGESVRIYDDIIVVGYSGFNNYTHPSRGAASVFYCSDYSIGTCTETVKLLPTVEQSYIYFGKTVALYGNIVVVGAEGWAGDTGAVFVFQCTDVTAGICPLLVTLTQPVPVPVNYFGSSVAIFGTTVVVGIRFDDIIADNSGALYIYDCANFANGECDLVHEIRSINGKEDDRLGEKVAISENFIFASGEGTDVSDTDTGAIYTYSYNCADCCPIRFQSMYCSECYDGWDGEYCDQCAEDFFGASCESCDLCVHGTCDQSRCECEEQWDGDYCEHCASTYFGNECQFDCSYCVHGTCSNGVCECDENYVGFRCHIFEPVC